VNKQQTTPQDFGTANVAQARGVSEATVRRRADAGIWPCRLDD